MPSGTFVPTETSLQAWIYEHDLPSVVEEGTCFQVLCGWNGAADVGFHDDSSPLLIAGIRPWYWGYDGWWYKGKWKSWSGKWRILCDGKDALLEVNHPSLKGKPFTKPWKVWKKVQSVSGQRSSLFRFSKGCLLASGL